MLVALDLDGTVLGADESISPAVAAAARDAQERGHEVMIATGRSWESTRPILERLGLHPKFIVCANGAVILQCDGVAEGGYRREFVETFDAKRVLWAIRPVLPGGSFMVEDGTGFRRFTEGMFGWNRESIERVNIERAEQVPFERLADVPAARVVVVSPDHNQEEFLAVVEGLGLHRVSYSIGWTAWLDIAPEGVSKASALERVRGLLDVPRSRVVAVGDGRNDVDMLRWAAREGRGVAMGGAPEEVLAAASESVPPVEDDGVAVLLASL